MSHETSTSLTSCGLMVALYMAPPPPGPTTRKSSAKAVRGGIEIAEIAKARVRAIIARLCTVCFPMPALSVATVSRTHYDPVKAILRVSKDTPNVHSDFEPY